MDRDFGGVTCGFRDPQAAVADWRNRWRLERQRLFESEQAARQGHATGQTRERLDVLATGYATQRASIEHMLTPILGDDRGGARETLLGLKTRLPSHHAPTSYATNICRDWVWGDAETDAAVELLPRVSGRTLVLGCGAGALAYALASDADEMIGLDSNPLLVLLAQQMNGGEAQQFVEFPLSPRTVSDTAVVHTLQPRPRKPNLRYCWADALLHPFDAGAFDTVVTHWLIDVIDAPLGTLAPVINQLLKPGGQWLNQGSLAYAHADLAENVSLPEAIEVTEAAGFDVSETTSHELPYLASPHSRQTRLEDVVVWRAEKEHDVTLAPFAHRPDWLTTSNLPVPLNERFQAQIGATRIHAGVMSLIDGRRSIADIAEELERSGLMPKREAAEAIRGMLTTMWEESLRPY